MCTIDVHRWTSYALWCAHVDNDVHMFTMVCICALLICIYAHKVMYMCTIDAHMCTFCARWSEHVHNYVQNWYFVHILYAHVHILCTSHRHMNTMDVQVFANNVHKCIIDMRMCRKQCSCAQLMLTGARFVCTCARWYEHVHMYTIDTQKCTFCAQWCAQGHRWYVNVHMMCTKQTEKSIFWQREVENLGKYKYFLVLDLVLTSMN